MFFFFLKLTCHEHFCTKKKTVNYMHIKKWSCNCSSSFLHLTPHELKFYLFIFMCQKSDSYTDFKIEVRRLNCSTQNASRNF